MKKILIIYITLILIIFILSGCRFFSTDEALEKSDGSAGDVLLGMLDQKEPSIDGSTLEEDDTPINNPAGAYSIPVIDGLHTTGTPIEINMDEYKLEVIGEVENPLSLAFDQVKEMDHVRIYAELECPGFFIDKGYWTGIEVKDLLELAEIKDGADSVQFIAYDGGYKKSLSIDDVFSSDGLIVAYHFDDNEFTEVHGYPLRIVAKGEIGAIWVKWLGKIEVLPGSGN